MNRDAVGTRAARCFVWVMGFMASLDSATAPAADRFADVDPYVVAAMKKWEAPGLALAVVKDGELVFAREYGECEVGSGRKVTPETAFPIASCSKSFTAAALGLLVDAGQLRWDDPVAAHLPGFELSDPYLTKNATVRDLLCHRTGLRRADLLQDGTGFSDGEFIRRLKHLDTVAEFRTRLVYNNHTYTVLNQLVESVSGRLFEQFVDERLCQPLNMKLSQPGAGELPKGRRSVRHWRSDSGIVAREASQTDGPYATARGLAQWLKLQLGEGTYAGRELLKPETIREMHALQFSEPVKFRPRDNIYAAQFYGAGLGWFVQDYRARKIVLHSGAWGSMMGIIPEEQLGVVILSNLDLESLAAMLMYDVFDAYLVGPEWAWNQRKWETTWLRNEPPGQAYRPRDDARALLEAAHQRGTRPSLPIEKYAGRYDSPLYGPLIVQQDDDQLLVVFGEHTTKLSHWQNESFYARAPTRLTFDWLLTFVPGSDGEVKCVTVKHIGWDKDEGDHTFERAIEAR